ncbi:hypothetical protein AgCh_036668 [Apium graveolens]
MEVCEVVALAKAVINQWREAQDKFLTSHGDTNSYAVAFATRNHKGDLIHVHSSCRPWRITPECAETVGIREVLSWIKDMNLAEVTVETDCLVAVQAIRSLRQMFSYFGRTEKDWDQADKRQQGRKEDSDDDDEPWMTMDTSSESGTSTSEQL